MLGYFKFAILAFLVLNASASMNEEMQSKMGTNIGREELMEAEIKALMAVKQVEEAAMFMKTSLLSSPLKCLPLLTPCSPNIFPQQCCSKRCGILPPFPGFRCGPGSGI